MPAVSVFCGWHNIHGLCSQAHYLQQTLPVALLITAAVPLFGRVNHQACFGGKRQLLWSEMSCDTSMGTIKKGAAQDFHYVHI
jgi:hypothetical protein